MATADRKTSTSVLAQLMGIDRRLPPPPKTHRRRPTLFSHNYLHNVSSVMRVDKGLLDANTNVECEETLPFFTTDDYSRMQNKWNEVAFSSNTNISDNGRHFVQRGPAGSYSLLGHSAVPRSFCASASENQKSFQTQLGRRRAFRDIHDTAIISGTNKKQKAAASGAGVKHEGLSLQKRRINSLRHNGMEFSAGGNVSPKGIAKQITDQVNHSVWHSYTKDPQYEGEVDTRETENTTCEMASSDTFKGSSRNMQRTKLKSWTERKYSQKVRTRHGKKIEDQNHIVVNPRENSSCYSKDVNSCGLASAYRCRVARARFLSKPTLFPSVWVPRSKERSFTFDRNWCSTAEDGNSDLCTQSLQDKVDTNNSSTSVSAKHREESTFDNTFSAGQEIEEVTVDEKIEMSSNLERVQLSAKLNKRSQSHDTSSSQKDFVLEQELKAKTSPPGSPVSSLEGPEVCRRRLNFTVSSNEEDGLPIKLDLIEAMSTESGSEGAGMFVSSDASDGGGSIVCYRDDAQIEEPTSGSCRFSYLVDVLVESGMMMGKLEMDSYVLNPLIFNLLENKYGKSNVRERSERRLLFDRIKAGLVEILRPCVGVHSWRKPVVKRLIGPRQSWAFVEEELWSLLVKQEEVESELSYKVCGLGVEWLDIEEDVEFMVEEVERLLIDELIEEFSMEMIYPQWLKLGPANVS